MSEVKYKLGGVFTVLEIFCIGLSLRLELFGFFNFSALYRLRPAVATPASVFVTRVCS